MILLPFSLKFIKLVYFQRNMLNIIRLIVDRLVRIFF